MSNEPRDGEQNDSSSAQETRPGKGGGDDVAVAEGALEKLADRRPEKVMEMISMGMSSGINPLHGKMDGTHIKQILDLATLHDERQFTLDQGKQDKIFTDKASGRRYVFATFVLFLALIVAILLLFQDKPDTLVPVLSGVGGFLAGALGGYGMGRSGSD